MNEGGAAIDNVNVSPDVEAWKLEELALRERLKDKLARAVGKTPEAPEAPNISLDIYYHAHAGAREAEGITEHFNAADIYIPEMCGWTEKQLEINNKISRGELYPRIAAAQLGFTPRQGPYEYEILLMIHDSNKPIAYIDYPETDPRWRESLAAQQQYDGIVKYWQYGNTFSDKMQEIKRRVKACAEDAEKREEFMLQNIKGVITTAIENNPKLRQKAKEKGELKVLLSLGSIHTGLSHLLQDGNNDVSSKFSAHPYIWGRMGEAVRMYRSDKEIDDDYAAKTLAEFLIYDAFGYEIDRKHLAWEQNDLVVRKLADLFSYDDVKSIIEKTPHGELAAIKTDLAKIIAEKSPEQYTFLMQKPGSPSSNSIPKQG